MRYPYERFLHFLVSRKLEPDDTLLAVGLPNVGQLILFEYRAQIRKTAPRGLLLYINSQDTRVRITENLLEWAGEQGYRELWELQEEFGLDRHAKAVDVAFRCFSNQSIRGAIAMLSLGPTPIEDTAQFIADRFEVPIDVPTLELYRRIFWDVTLMSRDAWNQFLGRLSENERHYLSIAFETPTLTQVRQLLDATPTVDPETVLKSILAHSASRFEAAMKTPRPEDHMAFKWAELTMKAVQQLKKAKPADVAGSEFKNTHYRKLFAVKPTKTEYATVRDLPGEISPRVEPKKA